MKPKYEESELRRNHLTVRFKDREHEAICYQAQRQHQTASAYMREIVIDFLEMEGVDLSRAVDTDGFGDNQMECFR